MNPLPMFPLGTVLFPHAHLPLQVFEPRYRRLTSDVLASDRRFGVVLIERGSEVGGGDQRAMFGTVAAVVEAVEGEGGRWLLATEGRERIAIEEWLPDDPYPRAVVRTVEEPEWDGPAGEALAAAERAVRRAHALLAELGEPALPAGAALSADPAVAGWQLAAVAPLGPYDRQRVLSVVEPGPRLRLLTESVEDACSVLAYRLSQG